MKDLFNLAYHLLTSGDERSTPPDYYSLITSDAQYLKKNEIVCSQKGNKYRRKAIALLTDAIAEAPGCKYCYLLRGIARWQIEPGVNELAILDCTKAITIDPDFAVGYLYRSFTRMGGQYCETPDINGALQDIGSSLEIDPLFGFAFLVRSELRKIKGNKIGAIADLDKAIEYGLPLPSNQPSWALYTRARLKKSLGLYEQALVDFSNVISDYPGSTASPFAFRNKAFLLRRTKRYQDLLIECAALLKYKVGFSDAVLEERAKVNRLLGKYKEAEKDYDLQLLLHPNNQEAYRNRGHVRKKLGDFERGKKDYQLYKKKSKPSF